MTMGSYDRLESEDQFWQALDDCLTKRCRTHELVDHTLRSWLYLVVAVRDALLHSEDDMALCVHKLMESLVYSENTDYVRCSLINYLRHDDESASLHVVTLFLLLDGRTNSDTFKLMIMLECFPRLTELIYRHGRGRGDARLHRVMLKLMFEMSRVERLRRYDLERVDDDFVAHLLQSIESVSDDARDNPTIRVLLVLNEQYMLESAVVASSASTTSIESILPLTNRVIKLLSLQGSHYRNFGENIILLLNREVETSYQLLILKILYLLFTNKSTYEYFYTNDLKVLVDIILRNLMDLPEDKDSLRHTYLRVLYPLLAHTQLSQPHSHYKKAEILAVLNLVAGQAGFINAHFAPTDDTTLRLVERTRNVEWLKEPSTVNSSPTTDIQASESERQHSTSAPTTPSTEPEKTVQDATAHESLSSQPESLPDTEQYVAARLLGMSLGPHKTGSSLSIGVVAAVSEKPGVTTPSRITNADLGGIDIPLIDGVVAGELPTGPVYRTNSLPSVQDHSDDTAYQSCSTETLSILKPKLPVSSSQGKKPLPQVPKHRHGIPISQSSGQPSLPRPNTSGELSGGDVSVSSTLSPVSSSSSSPSSSFATISGGAGAQLPKKIPPKAPPPRRTKGITTAPTSNQQSI